MMNKQILVIDDNEEILEMVEVVLDDSGSSVQSCTKADHVFENIEEYKPNLALMDYILWGINGAEMCHQIKSNHNTRHILGVVVSAHPCVLNLLGSYGCDAFIAKPFNITELFGRMDDCLGNVA